MAAFNYVAVDSKGKAKKGVLEADSPRQVRQMLREKGLLPTDVEQAKEKSSSSGLSLFTPTLKVAQLSLITRQLSTLVMSGLPLEECLNAAAEQAESARIRSMLMAVRSKLLEGYTLADSLANFPRAFPKLYRSTVSAGEQSGNLGLVLDQLADYVESQNETRSKIQNASIYPAILLTAAIGVLVFLLTTIIPKLTTSLSSSGRELPAATQFVLAVSGFLTNWWWALLIGIFAAVVSFWLWNRAESRRFKTHRLLLKLPLIGKMAKGFNTSRYASTLAILTSSGVPLVDAMRIAEEVIENLPIQKAMHEAARKVSEGGSLSIALKESGYMPPMMVHMVASGERSGEVDAMLARVADSQERSLKDLIGVLVSLFEPAMMVIMGGMVMLIVSAVIMPIMQASQVG
ncbi:type II secretion system inner membrane protein GspF [Salinibius halmophilus]|uniref:type II secretion system inner membrane protein GspF n=1 Tax=Salinibius halmophilus TaxID=1853216 RepID=UPI000E66C961|nr:type II secretion system inner membrane protein GspF [Salinibius halmophilus]